MRLRTAVKWIMVLPVIGQGIAIGQISRDLLEGTTPPAIAPGAAMTSEPLSRLESINLFSGGLNFSVPLLTVGGRGDVSYQLTVPIETRWIVNSVTQSSGLTIDYPEDGGTKFALVGYGPMYLEIRRAAEQDFCGSTAYDVYTLTRLHLISANGDDQELIDTKSGGVSQSTSASCVNGSLSGAPSYYSRGREFVSTDSSDITYEQDLSAPEIDDSTNGQGLTGFLYMRNGTRYRVANGLVQWMSDRNGNKISFDRTGDAYNRPVTITDPLGRTVTIEYGNAAGTQHVSEDWIKYSGAGVSAITRIIKVRYAMLADRLRSATWSTQPIKVLFPAASYTGDLSNVNSEVYNSTVVSEIEFPNGQKYQFLYNPYGELSRVTLPTGGVLEYDWASFTNDAGGMYGDLMIYRRLTERRIYTDGSALDGKTVYDAPPITSGGTALQIGATEDDPSGTALRKRVSTFWGTPLSEAAVLAGSPLAYPYWKDGHLYQQQLQSAGGATLQQLTNTWQQRNPITNASETPPDSAAPSDPRVTLVQRTLGSLTAQATYAYSLDAHNNVTEQCDYDYGATQAGRCVSRVFEISATYTAAPVHLRSLMTQETIKGLSAGSLAMEAQTTYQYDQTALVTYRNISQLDQDRGATYVLRGNATTVSRLLPSAPNSAATTQYQYDMAGNIMLISAPEVQTASGLARPQTTATYNDNYDANPGIPTYAFPTTITHPGNLITSTKFNFARGQIIEFHDPNGNVTSYQYGDMNSSNPDALDRLTNVNSPIGSTSFAYGNTSVTTTKSIEPGLQAVRTEFVDGLGRPSQTVVNDTYQGVGSEATTVRTYDALGRVHTISNPSRGGAGPVTTVAYDELDRPATTSYPDGSVETNCYSNNETVTRDAAGKFRKSVTDALGRLVQVVEDPVTSCASGNPGGGNYSTTYSYDGRGNLLAVTQAGRNRSFTYDELGRLKSSGSPETGPSVNENYAQDQNGTSTYLYDPAGNLTQRTDPRNVSTTFTYDILSRVTQKSYADGTPAVTYCYDGDVSGNCAGAPNVAGHNLAGRLTRVKNSVVTTDYPWYDALGRPLQSVQSFSSGSPFTFSYTYNDAALKTLTYPSGRTITYGYDSAARVVSVSGQLGASATQYVSGANYTAWGAMEDMTLASGHWEQMCYNSRMQAVSMLLRTQAPVAGCQPTGNQVQLTFAYNDGANNGNVASQSISDGASWTVAQTYQYDALNRLQWAQEAGAAGWKQTYGNDPWGNRWVDPTQSYGITLDGNTPQAGSSFTQKNRLNRGQGSFDLAGNQLYVSPYALAYDAENRVTAATSQSNGSASYAYDGDGRRVVKTDGTGTTYYVYDAMGQLAAEYRTAANPTPANCTTCFLFADHLGSTRAMWDASGVKARYDYLPFGEMIPSDRNNRGTASCAGGVSCYGVADRLTQRFTGKERDGETGLDFFGARYFSAAQGRFTSPDPIHFQAAMLKDPQRWNLYAYTRNNPLRYIDQDGEAIELLGDEEQRKKALEALQSAVGKQAGAYLYENKVTTKDANGNETAKYYVGIYTNGPDGKGPAFEKVNSVAGELAPIVNDTKVVGLGIVSSGSSVTTDFGQKVPIAPYPNGTAGITSIFGGQLGVRILDPAAAQGTLPPQTMSNGIPGFLDPGIVVGHEMGHARGIMTGDFQTVTGNPLNSDAAAIRLENKVRELKHPEGPKRLLH